MVDRVQALIDQHVAATGSNAGVAKALHQAFSVAVLGTEAGHRHAVLQAFRVEARTLLRGFLWSGRTAMELLRATVAHEAKYSSVYAAAMDRVAQHVPLPYMLHAARGSAAEMGNGEDGSPRTRSRHEWALAIHGRAAYLLGHVDAAPPLPEVRRAATALSPQSTTSRSSRHSSDRGMATGKPADNGRTAGSPRLQGDNIYATVLREVLRRLDRGFLFSTLQCATKTLMWQATGSVPAPLAPPEITSKDRIFSDVIAYSAHAPVLQGVVLTATSGLLKALRSHSISLEHADAIYTAIRMLRENTKPTDTDTSPTIWYLKNVPAHFVTVLRRDARHELNRLRSRLLAHDLRVARWDPVADVSERAWIGVHMGMVNEDTHVQYEDTLVRRDADGTLWLHPVRTSD